jgi:hypothetical protein
MAKNQHVIPQNGKWIVKGEGNRRATRLAISRQTALEIARTIARRQGTDVVIHGRDGRVLTVDAYGSDPFPPHNGTS